MTADKADLGMYPKWGVRKEHVIKTMIPVRIPPNVVRTPLELFTAERLKAEVTGNEPINEPKVWETPSATISWEASTALFPAE